MDGSVVPAELGLSVCSFDPALKHWAIPKERSSWPKLLDSNLRTKVKDLPVFLSCFDVTRFSENLRPVDRSHFEGQCRHDTRSVIRMCHARPLEGLDLAGGGGAVLFLEEGVVDLRRVEGRIKVNQVHRRVFDVVAEDRQVVAVVERAQCGVEG